MTFYCSKLGNTSAELHPTQDRKIACKNLKYFSNITLNVDLLSLLTMHPNHVTRRLSF